MRIPLLSGREFTESDSADGRPVAVINDVFARRFFAGRNPVGEHLAATVRNQRRDLEIVGVAKSTSAAGLRNTPPPTVYVAYSQLTGDFPTTVVIRAGGTAAQAAADIQQIVAAKIPGALIDVHPLASQVAATLGQERMLATLAAAFGAVALALACVGVYGLLAYSVAQRTKEIGIRMALGARRQRIVTLVMTSGARLVLIGLAAGMPVAWAASRWIESLLFGLAPTDPAVMGGAMALLIAAGQFAAFVPARRASLVDSLAALRHD
jgi:ABC-type antimicrobial peptide transport system permease subunit